MQLRKPFMIAGIFVLIIALGLGVLLLWATLSYNSEYVIRVLRMRESDVSDYLYNFPRRPFSAAPNPFTFDKMSDETRVAALFGELLGTDNFETFLQETDTLAFLVIQNDTILYEEYLNGADHDSLLTSFSVAKSFVSALIGSAIAEGAIISVDDPITDYLPELAERDGRFTEITIRHLLLMASGLNYQEMRPAIFNGDDPLTTYYPDQRYLALENTHIVDPPGAYFNYNKYHPQLLGMILERATGKSVAGYTEEKLWHPIGAEFDGFWNLDSEESGFEKMEAGFNARAVDYAKLGRLYLQKGRWGDEQVLPKSWIAESTELDPATQNSAYYEHSFGPAIYNNGRGYYKYMWYGWLRDGEAADFSAEGDHGQIIYVSPHKKLIIIRFGTEYGIPMSQWMDAFYEFASEFE